MHPEIHVSQVAHVAIGAPQILGGSLGEMVSLVTHDLAARDYDAIEQRHPLGFGKTFELCHLDNHASVLASAKHHRFPRLRNDSHGLKRLNPQFRIILRLEKHVGHRNMPSALTGKGIVII